MCHPFRGINTHTPAGKLILCTSLLLIKTFIIQTVSLLIFGIDNSSIQPGSVLMPTTRKQKKARKSRGLGILSDIENLDIMLGENHFNDTRRDESLDRTSIRRQESITSNNLENEEMNLYSDHRNLGVGTSAGYGQNSANIDSQAEINKLSCELNSRISREMDEMMNSVSSQIQRAISDAINNQVLPQIQNVIMAGSGQETRRGWERSDERPEGYSEVQHNVKAKTTFNSEHGDKTNRNVHDTTG